MAQYGSLFLLHVRLEGVPLLGTSELQMLLDNLPPYARVAADLQAFEQAIWDCVESLAGDHSVIFELATLGKVVRHSAILGCYMIGKPCFGRVEPVLRLLDYWGEPPERASLFMKLYAHRLYMENRGPRPPAVSLEYTNEMVSFARNFLHRIRSTC